MIINIYSKGKYPANALSNFAPNCFDFDGFTNIPCMEAFLQSLKFEDAREQQCVLYMHAKEAKTAGCAQKWEKYLYWNGRKLNRFSKDYFSLIENAYNALSMNPHFRQALVDSGRKILLHTIGKTCRRNTVLTWWEFTTILHKLRKTARRNGQEG